MTLINVDEVSVSLGGATVLDEVSARVPEGRFVGLIGPNGAGKTTLLRTMSGVLEPDAGRVTVAGDDISDLSSKASSRSVAVVPQDTTVSFDFSVEQVVEMGRHPYRSQFGGGTADDRRIVETAMERADVSCFADRAIGAVSGGERQRAILARALAQDAPVLLLDEPTGSLDVTRQVETLALVRQLVEEGKTAVAAIHDLDLAARFCDELLLLSGGDVVATGSPDRVLDGDTVSDAFDGRAVVGHDAITGAPTVRALPERVDSRVCRVHVIGTGHEAAATLARLVDAGFEPTIGPLPESDVAAEAGRALGVETLVAAPFESLGPRTLDELHHYAEAADATIIAGASEGFSPVIEELGSDQPVVAVEDALADGPHPLTEFDGVRTATLDDLRTAVTDVVDSESKEPETPVSGPK
ncbi:MAG: iron complex transport system ATP-binding protein [Halobacteriales archaeon]|jgi:iron complex transport system ATP-binding protein